MVIGDTILCSNFWASVWVSYGGAWGKWWNSEFPAGKAIRRKWLICTFSYGNPVRCADGRVESIEPKKNSTMLEKNSAVCLYLGCETEEGWPEINEPGCGTHLFYPLHILVFVAYTWNLFCYPMQQQQLAVWVPLSQGLRRFRCR